MLFAVEGGGFFSSSASGYSKGLTLLLLGQRNKEKPMRVIPWNQYQLVDQETKPDSDLQLDPGKRAPVRRCAFFVCLGHDAAGRESPPHVKVELPPNREDLPEDTDFDGRKDQTHLVDDASNGDSISSTVSSLKSSLKRSADSPQDDVNGNDSVHEVTSSSTISILKGSLKKSADSPRDDVNGNGSVHEVTTSSTISILKSSLKNSADSSRDYVNVNVPELNSNDEEALHENGNEITCQTQRRVQWTDTTGGELFEIREFEMSEDSEDEFDHRTKKTCACSIM